MMTMDRRPESAVLDRLKGALIHRGPDANGLHIAGPVGLVSTRLAIIDTRSGDQPICEPQGAALVANGEIYNDPELRLRLRDVRFSTGSDCESPLHLYRQKGLAFVDELRGMYAIAIYDPAASRLILARDPFGIKPLYYIEAPSYFAFASEPQALIAADLAGRRIRPLARAELFQLKFTTGSGTIFSQIKRVLPGETLVISDGRIVERRRRSALPQERPLSTNYRQALAQLNEVLSDSVLHHLRSDVPYGLFLSGGIDSPALAVLMARMSANPVVTLTIGFPGVGAVDERALAGRIARSIGAEHHVVEMTANDFWTKAPRTAAALDDPTTDAAALPTFALGEAAKGNLKVILAGEGGDEIFCGYSRYRRARWLGGWLTRYARTRGECSSIENLNGVFGGWRDGLNLTERQQGRADWTFMQKLQAVDCAEWLPNDLLTKLDRCLMRHGVEGRTPFLDPVVADFGFRLPDPLKATTRMAKRLLRDWLFLNLPAAAPYARKKAFNPPVGQWISARRQTIEPLVCSQPGVAEMFTEQDVHRAFANLDRAPQSAWSVLFYALWHSHHILGLPCDGAIDDVLAAARAFG